MRIELKPIASSRPGTSFGPDEPPLFTQILILMLKKEEKQCSVIPPGQQKSNEHSNAFNRNVR